MADAQGSSSPPQSSSSCSSTLSIVDDDSEVKHCTKPETGEEFSHEKKLEGEEEKRKDEDEEQEDEDEDEDEEEDEDEDGDEEADSAFQLYDNKTTGFSLVSNYPQMGYSRQEELRRILRALRGEPDDNQNRRCTRCSAMGHAVWTARFQFTSYLGQSQRHGYVPQQNPMQPNQAHSPVQEQATNPSEPGCSGSSSQEVDPESMVPSVSSASASQLGKRKSDSGSEMGSPTRKL